MKKWIKITAWIVSGITVIVLMVLVKTTQSETVLNKPNIVIHVNGENAFLTEDELYTRIKRKGLVYDGIEFKDLKIHDLERFVKSMSEIKNVRVYANIGSQWTIEVEIRLPIARIYNSHGESFYLDETGATMEESDLYTARVVVVTGEIFDRFSDGPVYEIINNDSLKSIRKLDDIYRISHYVCKDQLLQAQIGQIHLKENGDFVLIPLVGGHKIIFGSAFSEKEVEEKFRKLKVFYREAIPYEGWNKYEEISLKYNKQIVCKKKEIYE